MLAASAKDAEELEEVDVELEAVDEDDDNKVIGTSLLHKLFHSKRIYPAICDIYIRSFLNG